MTDYEAPAPTPDYDELLRLFTSKPGGHFKITLLVGGTWISGRAVSAAEWFDQEFGTSSDAAGLKDRVFGQEGEADCYQCIMLSPFDFLENLSKSASRS